MRPESSSGRRRQGAEGHRACCSGAPGLRAGGRPGPGSYIRLTRESQRGSRPLRRPSHRAIERFGAVLRLVLERITTSRTGLRTPVHQRSDDRRHPGPPVRPAPCVAPLEQRPDHSAQQAPQVVRVSRHGRRLSARGGRCSETVSPEPRHLLVQHCRVQWDIVSCWPVEWQ